MLRERAARLFLPYSGIYGRDTDMKKGRLISLISGMIVAVFNVFITGIFYTGFLTYYEIPITGVGIVSFIPYIASCFSIFSSSVLERFEHPKRVLLIAKLIFYTLYVLGVTVMPLIVHETQARIVCLCLIIFVAYAFWAVFSPGLTAWFYAFYPDDNTQRTRYITLNHITANLIANITLFLCGILVDKGSGEIILRFRYIGYALVVVDILCQALAKEQPTPKQPRLKLRQVFTEPVKHRKYFLCLLLIFAWNFNAYLNSGIWAVHLLNHMHFSYTLINAMSFSYTFLLLLFSPFWNRVLSRFSWIKTFGIGVLLWFPTELVFFCMTPGHTWMYVPFGLIQNFLSVCLNLSYANVLYMNLPEDHRTAHLAFHAVGCNAFAFLGLMCGTWITSFTGDTPIRFLWMQEFYSIQFTTVCRAVIMFTIGFICIRKWRSFSRDEDIERVDYLAAHHLPGPLARRLHRLFPKLFKK